MREINIKESVLEDGLNEKVDHEVTYYL